MDKRLLMELSVNLRLPPEEVAKRASSPAGRRAGSDKTRIIVDKLGLEESVRLFGVTAITMSRWYIGIQQPKAPNLRKIDELHAKIC
jgi:hypothetical protein